LGHIELVTASDEVRIISKNLLNSMYGQELRRVRAGFGLSLGVRLHNVSLF